MIRPTSSYVRQFALVTATLPYAAAIAATLWLFRGTFDDRLLGDIGDARWTISLHEHWYDVWGGRESIRDTAQYYPSRNLLGTTEPMFAQGQVYSVGRLLGLGLVDSWVVAQVGTYLFGVVGLAAASRRFLATWWAQVAFVLIAGISYPVALQAGHVQLLAIFWPAWFVVGVANLRKARAVRLWWFVVWVLPPVLALSSWYVLVLSAITAIVYSLSLALMRSRGPLAITLRALPTQFRRHSRDPWMVLSVVLGCLGWVAAAWIYLAGRAALPDPTWNEAVPFLPRWSDLINASGLGGGVWGPMYNEWFPLAATYTAERAEGFVPVLLVALVVATIVLFRYAVVGDRGAPERRERIRLLAAAMTCALVNVLFVASDDGFSLFKPFFLYVPGLNSIRAPFRVQGIVYALATFVVIRCCEIWVARTERGRFLAGRTPRVVLVVVLMSGMLIETNRGPNSNWTPDELLRPEIRQWIGEIRSQCDAVILVEEDVDGESWARQIDAVMLSILAGVPTPQGHGRADPIGFPGSAADPPELVAWMRAGGFDGTACAVSSQGVELVF